MATEIPSETEESVHLERRLSLVQATALNMANMIGVGPFITIPILMSALGGPQAMLGWAVAILTTIPDSMVWAELGAMMPGSGGSYVYLREGFGRLTWGRLMAFLFIWQFIISGPLEIASGYIGFAGYAKYLWPGLTNLQSNLLIVGIGLVTIALLYRRIGSIGRLTILLWAGAIATTLVVIVSGVFHFDARRAFDFPPNALHFSWGFMMGLGLAARTGVYDYLGYYDVCYIGDEVREPGKVIPRSILTSLVAVAAIYLGINLSIIGVIPWREFVPFEHSPIAGYIGSVFMERLYGRPVAMVFTAMVLWTAFASVFALLLGYSRIPYAAARDGYFFKVFARVHKTKHFPYVSLLVIGLIAIACGFTSLDFVLGALIVTRIPVQFIGQIVAIYLLRKRAPDMRRPYRIWLYPLTSLLALVGWVFLFVTADVPTLKLGIGSLALGVGAFYLWSRISKQWPFDTRNEQLTPEL